MRLLVTKCWVWVLICGLSASAASLADPDPRPGSQAALNGLIASYRETMAQLLKFEASAPADVLTTTAYSAYRDQVLTAVLLGLDNVNTAAANKLVVDLSAVYLGESIGPLYSCVVQRKAGSLSPNLRRLGQLNEWCSKELPAKFCLRDEDAALRLRSAVNKARQAECDLPLY
jgi:hypothetical protein